MYESRVLDSVVCRGGEVAQGLGSVIFPGGEVIQFVNRPVTLYSFGVLTSKPGMKTYTGNRQLMT